MRDVDLALLTAASEGDLQKVRRALKAGARINARDDMVGYTALGAAASAGHVAVIRLLVAAKAKVDAPDEYGRTPLVLAAGEGKVEAIRELLEAGADIEKAAATGETPLIEAARWGHIDAVKLLVDSGAKVARVVDGVTAYDHAVERKRKEVATYLASVGGTSALGGAKTLAREVGRAFGAPARRGGARTNDLPDTQFEVRTSYKGARIEIRIFDGGCLVVRYLAGEQPPAFALGRKFARLVKPVPAPRGLGVPIYRTPEARDAEVRAFLTDPRRRPRWAALDLSPDELFAYADGALYLLHRSTDLARLRARLDILAELWPPPAPVKLASESAHAIRIGSVMKRGTADTARHFFGGELERPVQCRNCRTPAHLILTIDTADHPLGVKRMLGGRPLPIIFCLDCMTFPSLTFVDHSRERPRIIEQDRGERHDETPPLEPREVWLTRLASGSGGGSKIGGAPRWIQGPEVPDCARCGEPMTFLVQLASTRHVAFADEGVLYTFVCAACKVSASLVQSH